MGKLLNSVFLVSGTAIGSGLISLPLSAAKLGIYSTVATVAVAFFVAYKTSCLMINLMKKQGKALSIVELSNEISGRMTGAISMFSLYTLSLVLLCAYFAGTVSILESYLNFGITVVTICCVAIFSVLFLIRSKTFSKINSVMVFVLFGLITCAICSITVGSFRFDRVSGDFSDVMSFLPIIFTSFGVQNVCPFVARQMGLDNVGSIKKAFLIGILIPAVVYLLWIFATLSRIYSFDIELYHKIISGGIEVGTLVKSLCDSAQFELEATILKLLSLFAVLTSAAGTGIGLISALRETAFGKQKSFIALIVIGLPAILTVLIPNAFMRILSFGGMIATIFVIFVPVYLNAKLRKIDITSIFCLFFGLLIIFSELFM